jgi:hypothetical protein
MNNELNDEEEKAANKEVEKEYKEKIFWNKCF